MKIKYWSDIACPFCYIGSNTIKKALKNLGLADKVPLDFLAYQLDPTLPKVAPQASSAENHPRDKQIEEIAHRNGLEMNLSKVIHVNSMDAHRLIKLAKDKYSYEIVNKLIDKLYHLYFVENKSIASQEVLKNAAISVGLKKDAVEDVLNSNKYEDDVKKDEATAMQLGVQGVPFFVINDKYAISGAQPYEVMVKTLKKIVDEEK